MAKRAGFILCLVVCALGVGASHARADGTPPPPTTIADGVQIGSVLVGGMTSEDATAAVQTAYFAPVVMRLRTYALPVPADVAAYVERATAAKGTAAWIRGALAEREFLQFEEPYRTARD